jgi:small-conductance mechanosensitive channel
VGEYLSEKLRFLDGLLAGNSVTDLLLAAVVTVAVWSGLWILRGLITARYARYSDAQRPSPLRLIAYLLSNTKQFFFLAVALDAGEALLTLPDRVQHVVRNVVLILLLIQVGLWAGRALRFYLELKEKERGADRTFAGSLDIINFVAQMIIWSLLTLAALDNLGVNITALLAGLGVGGVAVALALQNVLGDLFASLSIALDKPFVVGDGLTIDTFVGKVEHIGIKTTRLRSESGEQIILSNADILKSRVRNFGRLSEQRVLTTLRVSFDTPTETLKALPRELEKAVREHSPARFERCHLKTLGDTAFIFELSYFVQQPVTNPLLDLQQAVNYRIIEVLRAMQVDFAYPAQLVVVEQKSVAAQRPVDAGHAPKRADGSGR